MITHAGMGSAVRALANGVPMVCMPMGRDQKDIAARVYWHGAGLRIGHHASPGAIRGALQRVLDEPVFRENAQRLQQAILEDVAADRAVIELEALAEAASSSKRE